ncbi:Soluble starch synthase 3, chloroplastic/amyloplastic [Ancistrocladus abbreviatus]
MEAALQAQTVFSCRPSLRDQSQLNIKPFFGFFYKPTAPSCLLQLLRKECPSHGISYRISASADFSRKRPKKVSAPRSRSSPPKGFMPKAPAAPGMQKHDQRSRMENESSTTSTPGVDKRTPDIGVGIDDNRAVEISQETKSDGIGNADTKGKVRERSIISRPPAAIVSSNQSNEHGSILFVEKSKNVGLVKSDAATTAITETGTGGKSLAKVEANAIAERDERITAKDDASEAEASGSENAGGVGEVGDSSQSTAVLPNADVESALLVTGVQGKNFDTIGLVESDESNISKKEARGSEDFVAVDDGEDGSQSLAVVPRTDVGTVLIEAGVVGKDLDSIEDNATLDSTESIEIEDSMPETEASGSESVVTLSESVDGTPLIETGLEGRDLDSVKVNDVTGDINRSSVFARELEGQGLDGIVVNAIAESDGSIDADQDIAEVEATTPESIVGEEDEVEDSSARLKLEMETQLKLEMEAQLHKQAIEQLAHENFTRGNRLFTYPQVVKPDQDIKVFLNRSLSSLKDEPDVMIMGAFNDWRWNSFTIKLDKSYLNGDWWSCKIHVPKQAYKIDFVFFNGKNVYDNNDKKDFHILVDGGMDVSDFEDFLLEEKRKELEKLAKEQAERERQEEEQRHIEAMKAAREADRAQAKIEVEKRREKLRELIKKAATCVDNVWYFELIEVTGEDRIRLYYNRSSGPLAQANEIWVHGGYNGWQDGLSTTAKLVQSERKGVDWWCAEVTVPDQALVFDWVFANGPPQKATIYDNNHRQDFHGIVPKSIFEEKYWVEEEDRVYKNLQEERRLREEAIRAKAEKTAHMKAETKERTLKRFLLSQKHIAYTDPLDIQAGSTVTVYYNPVHTVLNGKPEIWFRCSFNRWTHRKGPLPPQKMVPAENISHMKTTVKVPLDVYMMDFVFSEREDGGLFDNKYGMDYHIPVFGGIVKEPPLHIVHIAVEMAPIAKVGGLGDVVTSLSRAVQDLNHHVDIILPKYDCINFSHVNMFWLVLNHSYWVQQVKDLHYQRSYSWSGTEIKVWFGKVEGLSVYFLEPANGFFWTGCIYGCQNDAQRFGFFCHAALEFLLQSGFHPDIIHCHDWSSAPVSWLYREHYTHYGLCKARVVFTIHNLEFGAHFIGKAMAFSDKATTVSPTYSKEVARNPAVAAHNGKFHGILNGIDPDIWDPYNDRFIPVSYTSENVAEGKQAAKRALQQRLGLKQADLPFVGMITRLTHQKGIHLIKHAIWRTLERNGQVVLLGSAPDPRIQNDFVNLANQLHSSHGDRARLCLTYDEPLSHLIYAGADVIVVPSIFEPCGLTQLVAMRYGSIPVVRKTGGLYDTVFDVDHDKERAQAQGLEPNGFNFEGADTAGVDYALNRAISAWYDNWEWFNSLCKRVMEQDWSWNRPALDYLELYHAACK